MINIKLWKVTFLKNNISILEVHKQRETKLSLFINESDKPVKISKYIIGKPQSKNDKVWIYVNAETEKGALSAAQEFCKK